jgi:hypothetical protein
VGEERTAKHGALQDRHTYRVENFRVMESRFDRGGGVDTGQPVDEDVLRPTHGYSARLALVNDLGIRVEDGFLA